MGQLITLSRIARLTGYDEVRWVIVTAARNGDDMINVVTLANLLMAVIAAAFLGCVLTLLIGLRVMTWSLGQTQPIGVSLCSNTNLSRRVDALAIGCLIYPPLLFVFLVVGQVIAQPAFAVGIEVGALLWIDGFFVRLFVSSIAGLNVLFVRSAPRLSTGFAGLAIAVALAAIEAVKGQFGLTFGAPNQARGIMGLHRNSPFCARPRDAREALPGYRFGLSSYYTTGG